MFTGIIRSVGKIKKLKKEKEILTATIEAPRKWEFFPGESIAVDGVCSTLVTGEVGEFTVQYMPETLRKTTIVHMKEKQIVNLERSLLVGEPMDGHFVSGHVDTIGEIKKIKNEGDSKIFEISLDTEFRDFVIYKGSVTVDGVSLTVSKVTKAGFEVSLIPYTLTHTNLDKKKVGDLLNVECDMLGKYVITHAKKTKRR